MTVQIQPARPKDQHNGLADLEADLMKDPDLSITAIVTYRVAKLVDDRKKHDQYPVVYAEHIEPILGDARTDAEHLQLLAYQSRTGENELDLDFEGGADDEQGDDE
jgi:hypothetical protein